MSSGATGMKLPHPRFTVRRLIVSVTVVALALGATHTYRRYSYCRSRATFCAESKARYLQRASLARDLASTYRQNAKDRREVAQSSESEGVRTGILNAARIFDQSAADQDRQVASNLAAAERASAWREVLDHLAWRPWQPMPRELSEPE
jgi:hypothetical protein